MLTDFDSIILRFFREDIQGVLITAEDGTILYEDGKAAQIMQETANWNVVCPPLNDGQKGEIWDLPLATSQKTYMVITSTFVSEDNSRMQIHHFVENSAYMALYRDINEYSRMLREEKERDGMTGLYNKGKFLALKKTLFQDKDAIAIFNMDVNNLKRMNDTYGHDAGDKLLKKAAESLRKVEARNVFTFRMGGDEFMIVALHVSRGDVYKLRKDWEAGLAELNQQDDGITCVIACGVAYGERGYDLEELLSQADQRMYEEKKRLKADVR